MIPRSPDSVLNTKIFKQLERAKDDRDGLVAKALRFIELSNPILDTILSGPFKNYTLHNRDHAKKLLHIAEHIIDPDTLSNLSKFECLLLIYSCYIHDMGMAIPQSEIEEIIKTPEFVESVKSWPALHNAIDTRRDSLNSTAGSERTQIELELADLHCVSLANFLRPFHATVSKYKSLIKLLCDANGGAEILEIRNVNFEDELIDICASHNLDAAVLTEMRSAHEERFPRDLVVSDHRANTQFLSAVLRLADILDFDFERTPRVLIECLGLRNKNLPGSEVSLQEWEKHLSVQQIDIKESELVVHANSKHPAIETAVREFCSVIEGEIRRTLSVVKRNPPEIINNYKFRLPSNVRAEIKSNGYVYMDLSLRLNESAVMTLLMGTSLYPSRYAAIRELIQNAVDACLVRSILSQQSTYRPTAKISNEYDNEGYLWIAVQDNGIGMDEGILKNHFFRIGSSYYDSSEFERLLNRAKIRNISVISKFGIGFLSVFMLADSVEIETKSIGLGGADIVGRRIRVDRVGAIAFVQEDSTISRGTTVRIRVPQKLLKKRDIVNEIATYIKQNILRPPVPIRVLLDTEEFWVATTKSYKFKPKKNVDKILNKNKVKIVSFPIEDYSETFQGDIYLFFVLQDDDETLGIKHNGKLLEVTSGLIVGERFRLDPNQIFENFDGNRVSVGGFRMMWPKLNRLLRRGPSFVSAVYDLDIKPGKNVEFDVARKRIIDQLMILRIDLRKSIFTALQDLGVAERIRPELHKLFKSRSEENPFDKNIEILLKKTKLVDDDELLDRVENALPKDFWPRQVHHVIANKLGISKTKSFSAITTLVLDGRVSNPNRLKK